MVQNKEGDSVKKARPYKRYTAFTLAEVLITLGVIGIIAALTIPSVSKNIRHDELRQLRGNLG